jgi:hypothetical protein
MRVPGDVMAVTGPKIQRRQRGYTVAWRAFRCKKYE